MTQNAKIYASFLPIHMHRYMFGCFKSIKIFENMNVCIPGYSKKYTNCSIIYFYRMIMKCYRNK